MIKKKLAIRRHPIDFQSFSLPGLSSSLSYSIFVPETKKTQEKEKTSGDGAPALSVFFTNLKILFSRRFPIEIQALALIQPMWDKIHSMLPL